MGVNSDNKEKLEVEVERTDDSCKSDFIEIVPTLARNIDGFCTTENVNSDWSGEFRDVDLADLKQEPDTVCCVLSVFCIDFFTTKRMCAYLCNYQLLPTGCMEGISCCFKFSYCGEF